MLYKNIALYQAIAVASGLHFASAACPEINGTFTLNGVCNVQTVQAICPDVTKEAARVGCQEASVKFEDIAGNHYQYDKEYMDGGTVLNDILANLPVDAGRISAASDNVASNSVIAWPEYEARAFYESELTEDKEGYAILEGDGAHMTNFDLDYGCDLRTVMCCFVENEKGVFDDNTDVCHQDLSYAKRSNHVSNGFATMDGGDPTHCVGFSWADGEESDALKGNALYHISLKNRIDNGYAKNVPGAPMCACIEQMPTVEKAACVDVTGTSTFTFIYEGPDYITGTNEASVSYSDCGGDDLKIHFERKASETEVVEMDKHFVGAGGCVESNKNFLNNEYFIPSATAHYLVDTNRWVQWAGYGMNWYPYDKDSNEEKGALVRSLLDNSPEPIIYRHCKSCKESHQFIYYKRRTAWPSSETLNIAELFMNNWRSENNLRGVDFDLYSSYEDALNEVNAWQTCNYDHGNVGFPRDCAPVFPIGCQWSSYKRHMCHDAQTHAFYIEKSQA